MYHGFAPNSLHKIKEGKLEKPNPRDWSVFDKEYIDKLENERFNDVTQFINKISKIKGVL